MADVAVAPEQDAIADSLLGEPEEQQTAETTGTEQQEVVTEGEPTLEVEEQQAEPETAEDWLPTEQDKVFSDDVLLRYAERYQKDQQWLSDPLNRQLLIDKLNSDIFLRQQQEQQAEFEPEPEYEEAQPEPTQQAQPQITREQYFQNLDRVIAERTDPQVAKAFHSDFLRAFGVPEAEIAKLPPQQAMQFSQTASKYMLNLVSTFLPDMLGAQLQGQISQAFPGFGEMYERSAYAMAWDRVRNSNPQYAGLPAYGSKEFSSKLREAAQRIPGFEEMQFTGRDGKPLPMMDNAMRKYGMLAQIASGQSVDPRLVQQAAQAGARNARRAEVKRSAANLGSGQSRSASGRQNPSRFQTNSDLFDDDAMEIYQKNHGRL